MSNASDKMDVDRPSGSNPDSNSNSNSNPNPPSLVVSKAVDEEVAEDDQDKLSDFLPQSADLSRSASRMHSKDTSPVNDDNNQDQQEGEGEGEGEDQEAADADDTNQSSNPSPSKTARQLEKQRQKESVKQEKNEKKQALDLKKQAQNNAMSSSRKEVQNSKQQDSMKRFSYLLGQTELFQHFIDIKKERDPEFARMVDESQAKAAAGKGKPGRKKKGDVTAADGARRRKTEKEEDEELLKDGGDEVDAFAFMEPPPYVTGGKMRDYQVQGLNWMISLYQHGINGILADEMGLGKTLQTISFLGYLKYFCDTPGLHLVVVPKSTLDNWKREFEKWIPGGFKVITLQGSKEERNDVIQGPLLSQDFDVLITTYEMCLREKAALKKLSWEYIVIDEAHRIKNVDSMLSQIVRAFTSRSRLLITGTPLQNNLMELWSLLNFLLPDVFSNHEDFESWFKNKGEENQDQVVQQLHKVLRPFLLRRVKADVEKSLLPKKEINVFVGLTDMQRKWYKSLLEKDIDAVNGSGGKKEGKTRLLNIVMQLRKCCNHPYLFDGAEPGPPFTTDEHLIFNSGKMIILDKLLAKMKEKGSRVLIFSQMSRVLDILEDYCIFRDHQYCRIDGNSAHEERIAAIDDYNRPGSEKFVFLLTTRAGGLGINLTTADIVVLFDSDWNPQADLQAMDRAHRIGQTKQVYVFRFVTEKAIEERILDRAAQKLKLDQLVIQQGRAQNAQKAAQNKEDLVDMIQHGAEEIISDKVSMTIDDDIDAIIAKGEERTALLQKKYEGVNLDDLNNFKSETSLNWEGTEYAGGKKKIGQLWIEPSKRERKANYSVDNYYRETMRQGGPKPAGPKAPKAPKQISLNEWQFPPARFIELQNRETWAHQASVGHKVPPREPKNGETAEQVEEQRQAEQEKIDAAQPLTEEEEEEKESLADQGFRSWTKRDFNAFVAGCAKHGRDDYASIAEEIGDGTKTEAEVREYAEVFWKRYSELSDGERAVAKIEEGEAKKAKQEVNERSLRRKIASYKQPLQEIKLTYNQTRGKAYSEEEDRFLLVRLAEHGLGGDEVYDKIKKDVAEHPAFRFDWFIKSRTPAEIGRRCMSLLSLLLKDDEEAAISRPGRKPQNQNQKRGADALNGGSESRDSTPAATATAANGSNKRAKK